MLGSIGWLLALMAKADLLNATIADRIPALIKIWLHPILKLLYDNLFAIALPTESRPIGKR